MKKVAAVDLDGVLAHYTEWKGVDHIGDPIPGAQEFLRALSTDFDVTIFTVRTSESANHPEMADLLVRRVLRWLRDHQFPDVNVWAGHGKPVADVYIDDRALNCAPQKHPHAFAVALTALGIGSASTKEAR